MLRKSRIMLKLWFENIEAFLSYYTNTNIIIVIRLFLKVFYIKINIFLKKLVIRNLLNKTPTLMEAIFRVWYHKTLYNNINFDFVILSATLTLVN